MKILNYPFLIEVLIECPRQPLFLFHLSFTQTSSLAWTLSSLTSFGDPRSISTHLHYQRTPTASNDHPLSPFALATSIEAPLSSPFTPAISIDSNNRHYRQLISGKYFKPIIVFLLGENIKVRWSFSKNQVIWQWRHCPRASICNFYFYFFENIANNSPFYSGRFAKIRPLGCEDIALL